MSLQNDGRVFASELSDMLGCRFGYLELIPSPLLTETKEEIVKRTWKERIFSRPWRPFLKTKMNVYQVPYPGLIKCGDRQYIAHPFIIEQIKKQAT